MKIMNLLLMTAVLLVGCRRHTTRPVYPSIVDRIKVIEYSKREMLFAVDGVSGNISQEDTAYLWAGYIRKAAIETHKRGYNYFTTEILDEQHQDTKVSQVYANNFFAFANSFVHKGRRSYLARVTGHTTTCDECRAYTDFFSDDMPSIHASELPQLP